MKYPSAECSAFTVMPVFNETFANLRGNDTSFLYPEDVEMDIYWDWHNLTVGNTGKLEVSEFVCEFERVSVCVRKKKGTQNTHCRVY